MKESRIVISIVSVLLFLSTVPVQAHIPYIEKEALRHVGSARPGEDFSFESPFVIPPGDVYQSRSIYSYLSANDVDVYQYKVAPGESAVFYASALPSACKEYEDFFPATVLIGPGGDLDAGGYPFNIPDSCTGCGIITTTVSSTPPATTACRSMYRHEDLAWFTDTGSINITVTTPGTYYIVMWNPDGRPMDLTASIGSSEGYTLDEAIHADVISHLTQGGTILHTICTDPELDALCDCHVPETDSDGDGIPDCVDNCQDVQNEGQFDCDGDNIGDTCDVGAVDSDDDGIDDDCDNCPFTVNPDQFDCDEDGIGNACDGDAADTDGDGVDNKCDNCPDTSNPDQFDCNDDGIGDACDTNTADSDGDGIPDNCDNCPAVPNVDQKEKHIRVYVGSVASAGTQASGARSLRDSDCDGIADECPDLPSDCAQPFADKMCDNCPDSYNPGQEDDDANGIGDACEGGCTANLNGDTKVGILDLLIIKQEYNITGCEPTVQATCCKADITGDGKVSILDLTQMKQEYNRTDCTGTDPPCAF